MNDDFLISLFCIVDDFCKSFENKWNNFLLNYSKNKRLRKRTRWPRLSLSEIMTILIYFQHSGYRTFKRYYTNYVQEALREYFPNLVSYSRIVQLTPHALFPIFCFLQSILGTCSGISFVDSTMITVCHNRRINSYKVFKDIASRGKSSTGWFFGFKLHLVINDQGDILAYNLTSGNVDDRVPLKNLCKDLFGKIFGDRGYISSKHFKELYSFGLELITKLKKNMKNKLMLLWDKLLLRKRGVIESVNNKLKNEEQIEHHRHRSRWNFCVNLLCGLTAYQLNPIKPNLSLRNKEMHTIKLLAKT